MIVDHNRFWEAVFTHELCVRLQLVFDIAVSEGFARNVFKAYSATARLRTIAQLLAWSGETGDGEKPRLMVVQ